MVLIKDLGNGDYQLFPITDDMIEVEDPDAWSRARRPQPTQEDVARKEAMDRMITCVTNLGRTDYVVTKIAEAQVFAPETVDALRAEYAGVIADRARWRAEINDLRERYGLE